MSLATRLHDYVAACFTGLWIQTHEPDEAEREIVRLAAEQRWKWAAWDIASGLRLQGQVADTAVGDPLAVLKAMPALAEPDGTLLLLLQNYHRFLANPEVVQTVFRQLIAGKQQRTFVIILAPVIQIPVELEKLFVVIEHALPDRKQLHQILEELTQESPGDRPAEAELAKVLDAAAGLTRYEAEGAFALSLARHGQIRPEAIWEIKAQTLQKNHLLTLHRGQEGFDQLGGLQSLKDFCAKALKSQGPVKPRGALLVGPPGCGKSQFAKSLGVESGRPTLILDLGSLYGGVVGETERNVRQALGIIDAMAPCVAFIDEVDKGLSGVGSSGDSGVSSRLFGTVLSWLNDHETDVFVIATSNDIGKLPPEFARAERFDGIFYLDLPDVAEKDSIWELYRSHFGVPNSQARPDDTGWTGAEIKACCRLAMLLDVPLTQAARNVVPVSVTAAESIEKLRTWAKGRCLSASQPGVYGGEELASPRNRRRAYRGPSNN